MIRKYARRTLYVEAVQFTGWEDVADIHKWAVKGQVLYVPAGAIHEFRKTSEVNWEKGDISTESPEFLMITTPDGEKRVNIGDFIMLSEQGDSYVADSNTFDRIYELKLDETITNTKVEDPPRPNTGGLSGLIKADTGAATTATPSTGPIKYFQTVTENEV